MPSSQVELSFQETMETARPGSKAEARRSGPSDGKCPSPVGLWQAGTRAVCLVVSASRVSGIGLVVVFLA